MRLLLLVGSVALIIGATLFPFGGAAEPGVGTVRWCLVCGERWLADEISNVLLFVPFGAVMLRVLYPPPLTDAVARTAVRGAKTRALLCTTALGGLLSLFVECLQYLGWPPGRSPALADLLTNALGTAVGAALAMSSAWWLRPSTRQANVLTIVWSLGGASVLLLTGYALGEPHATFTEPRVRPSSFGYAPAFGWYGGTIAQVGIEGELIMPAPGSGPVVRVVSPVPWAMTASAKLDTLDPATNVRAVLYVHSVYDSLPVLMIGQQGGDALLISARRASRWGLAMPRVRLRDAWTDQTFGDPRGHTVQARVSGRELRLELQPGDGAGTADETDTEGGADVEPDRSPLRTVLPLSPALGWALVQSVITPESPLRNVVLFCWLALFSLPLGWWSMRAGRLVAATGAAILLVGAIAAPVLFSVHELVRSEWLLLVAAYSAGHTFAKGRPRKRGRGTNRRRSRTKPA